MKKTVTATLVLLLLHVSIMDAAWMPVYTFTAAGSETCRFETAGLIPAEDSSSTGNASSFADNNDMSFQMRGSFNITKPDDGKLSARFRMDNFRWNVEGRFGKKKEFYYHFRQSFNANFRSNVFDGLLASIDYAYMTWRPLDDFSFTFGKQVFALGGQEFWAAPVYVMQYSDFGGSLACYQMGLTTTWHISPTQELAFQMSNIRGVWDDEYYYGGMPDGIEPTGAPFLYTLNWNGTFLDNNALELRYSASYGQQAVNRSIWFFTMGQSYRREKWGVYLDLLYSRQGLDANGLISSNAVFPDGMVRTLENVDYGSVIGYLHLFISPSFSAFVKGAWEFGLLSRPYGEIPSGLCRMSWNGQGCLEYMPTKDRNFRLFLHYNYYDRHAAGNGDLLGIPSYQEHRVSLGIIYIMNIF